jgi:hypothetical protein
LIRTTEIVAKAYVFLIFIEIKKATESWSTGRHISTPCAVEVECMNDFVFNFANIISFKSVLTSNISFYNDRLLSLHFVNIIIEFNIKFFSSLYIA